jgi:hypothetical protein
MTDQNPEAQSRAEFEALATGWGWNLRKWPDGSYQGANAKAGWRAWTAARAARDDLAEVEDALKAIIEAADNIERTKFFTYKARNGREVSIQGDDGERVDLVHSDQTHALQIAANNARALISTSEVKP